MTRGLPIRHLAKRVVSHLCSPADHLAALTLMTHYVEDNGLDKLPVAWHDLARRIADVYSVAGLQVVSPEPVTTPTDERQVCDDHALRLVVLCQANQRDAWPAVNAYATKLEPTDSSLWIEVTLRLAMLVADLTEDPRDLAGEGK